jgi:VCBS repeat-containing protein
MDYYVYAILSTAAYVRMGDGHLTGARLVELATAQSDGRLPRSLATVIFNPADPEAQQWIVAHYHAGDTGLTPDDTGLGATLFQNSEENVLAIRGVELSVDLRGGDDGDPIQDLFGAGFGGIGMLGVAVTQLVELTNLIERLFETEDGSNTVTQVRAWFTRQIPQSEKAKYLTLGGELGPLPGPPVHLAFETYEVERLGILEHNEKLTLTGHSLGGHLAAAAAQVLPQRVGDNVVVFNSPGFDPVSWAIEPISQRYPWIAATLGNLSFIAKSAMAESLGVDTLFLATGSQMRSDGIFEILRDLFGTIVTEQPPIVQHLKSEDSLQGDDLSLVASWFSGSVPPGAEITVPTEVNSHSIEQEMDALALHAAFYRLDGALTLQEIKQFVDYARNIAETSEEFLVESLHALLIPDSRYARNGLQLLTSDASDGEFDLWTGKGELAAREAHHLALLEINAELDNNPGKQFSVESLIEVDGRPIDAQQIKDRAKNGPNAYAFRHALKHGLPFAVIGVDYEARNENGALEFYDPARNTGDLTQAWLGDVAEFYYWKNRAFIADLRGVGDVGTSPRSYIQLTSDVSFYVAPHPDPDPLSGAPMGDLFAPTEPINPPRTIFGSDLPDELVGGLNSDRMYGGPGADFLRGLEGDDYLEGGLGFDVYQYGASREWIESAVIYSDDGADTVMDTDGKGVLRYVVTDSPASAQQISVLAGIGIQVSSGQWESADGRFQYTMEPTTDPQPTLRIDVRGEPGGTVFLKDWQDGEFFITLEDARADYITTTSILGDFQPVDAASSTPEIELEFDSLGNVVRIDVPEPGRDDILLGDRPSSQASPDAAGERFDAGAGNDTMLADRPNGVADNGLGNADWISAGQGRDWIEAGAGNDLIEGGGGGVLGTEFGGEIVHAGSGNDQVYSVQKVAIADAISEGTSGATLAWKGDFVYGGDGDDWIVGSGLSDVLNGGEGSDLIVAGAGDDVVDGDVQEWATTFAWNVTRKIVATADDFYDYLVTINGAEKPEGQHPDEGSDDYVYAGAGSDVVYGRGGNDYINAGTDDDFVFGGAGEDVVIGGAGDDLLAGDGPATADTDAADYLEGGAGNDILWGADGDDFLVGGRGADILDGGGGADVYLFARGDGNDTFRDTVDSPIAADASVFVFGDGIAREDLTFSPGSLIIDLGPSVADEPSSPHDTIYVEGFDADDPFSTPLIAALYFADGDVMSFEDIVAQGFDIDGTEFSDNGTDEQYPALVGTEIRDQIRGLAGDDVLIGLGGNDVLEGGAGADIMQGGAGDDLYLVDALDGIVDAEGSNRLEFVDGTTAGDVQIIRTADLGDEYLGLYVGSHVIVAIDPIEPAFELFSFSDGTNFSNEELLGARFFEAQTLIGGDEDDILVGHAGDDQFIGWGGNDVLLGYDGEDVLDSGAGHDILDGGGGDDQLLGGAGSDVYLLYSGSGKDRISEDGESNDYDVVAVEDGLTTADVKLERLASGSLSVTLPSGDSVEVKHYYNDPRAKVEALAFTDGTVIDSNVLDALEVPSIVGTDSNDTLTGTEWVDTIEGLAGDDVLIGGAANDSLDGGPGVDVYLLEFGGEQDVVTDDGGVIRLGTSLTLAEVDAFRQDSGLSLRIRGTTDSILVSEYFEAPEAWSIEGAHGEPGNIPGLLTATAELGTREFERAVADYEAALKAQFLANYRAQGYQLTGGPTLFRRQFDPAFATYVAGTQTTTTTTTLFSNPDNPTTTVATYSLNNWSYEDSGEIRDDTVTLSKEVIVSDDGLISGFVGTDQDWSYDHIWASIDWKEVGTAESTVSVWSSGGFINGTGGVATGTVENVYEAFSTTGAATSVLEDLHPGQSFPYPDYTKLYPDKQQLERTTTWTVKGYSEVVAGDSDNYIIDGAIVDAGGGDDTVVGAQVAYGGDGNDNMSGGQALFGGTGADILANAGMLGGGDGNDYLVGFDESNRFVFLDGESGRDLIIDRADYTYSVKSWYYHAQLDIPDWEVRDEFGGSYAVAGYWFDSDDFPVEQSVADWLLDPTASIGSHPDYEWMSGYEINAWFDTKNDVQADLSLLSYVEPLPPLPVSGANDYAALLPLYDSGVLRAADHLALPDSITSDALIAATSLVEILLENPETARIETYAALDIAINSGQSALVVIPHADDSLGSGVEWFSFADGSTLSIRELLDALLVPAEGLDPQNLDNVIEVTAADAHVYSPDSGYEISGGKGNDQILGAAFGDILYGDEGDDALSGGGRSDDLYGGQGNDKLFGGDGDDYLYGGDGNDALDGGSGSDELSGEAGDDTYLFGSGAGEDLVYEQSGALDVVRVANGFAATDLTLARNGHDLTLGLNGGADRMTLDNWFGLPDRVEQIVFDDGTIFDEAAMIAASDRTMTAVDDLVSLLEGVGSVSGNVLGNDFSSKAGAALSITNPGRYAGAYGALALGEDGSYSYVLDGNFGQSLAQGETAADVFSYSVEDDQLTGTDASLRIDIVGQNDIVEIVLADISGSVTEDAGETMRVPVGESLIVNGGFETGDSTGWTISTTNPFYISTAVAPLNPRTGAHALVGNSRGYVEFVEQQVVTDPGESYVLELSLQGGLQPELAPFGFEISFSVDWGEETLFSLTDGYFEQYERLLFELTGSGAENALVIGLLNGAPDGWYVDDVTLRATEKVLVIPQFQTTEGVIHFSDLDAADAHSVSVTSGDIGYLGAFDAQLTKDSTGTGSGSVEWNFSVSNADLAFLSEGRTFTQNYDVWIDDGGLGGAISQTVAITINGTGDGINTAPIAIGDAIVAQEDGGVVIVPIANLLANDSDADIGDTLTITSVSVAASGASVGLGSDSIAYDPGTFFQALREGAVATDSFNYTIADDFGETSTATVTVNLAGVNDEPFAVTPLDNQTAIEETAFAYTIPTGAFGDIDQGEVLTLSATLAGGLPLPNWLKFDALTGSFSGTPLADDVGLLNVSVTATDSSAASVSQSFDLDVRYLDRIISAGVSADTLSGGGGNDTLDGAGGADLLAGGGGNDLLLGGFGSDTYVYNLGDGVDTIADSTTASEINSLEFGPGITPDMLSLSLGSLVISIGGDSGAVHLESFDVSDPYNTMDVTRFVFDDGTVWDAVDLLSLGIAIEGTSDDDVLGGTTLSDRIYGFDGDDVLNGGEGRDHMAGGKGDDTYFVGDSHGSGGRRAWFVGAELDTVVELSDEGWDSVFVTTSYTLPDHVESLTLAGSSAADGTGNALNNVIMGNGRGNVLSGLEGDDFLSGGDGVDLLRGGRGVDILQGGDSADFLRDANGIGLFDGGAGVDILSGNDENSALIGGAGADLIGVGTGHDIVLYNLGEGADVISATPGQSDTLSLGGGIAYDDLTLRKRGRNLILKTGRHDSVTFTDWYASPENQTVANLQVIVEAMAEFSASSTDPLLDKKIHTFDFRAIVDAFDESRGRRSWSREWDVMDALLDAHLGASDNEALGGDIAYRYGLNGSLAGIGVTAVQDVLNAPQFGSAAQTLRPIEELQQGLTRLS